MKICQYLHLHRKIICWRFAIKTFNFLRYAHTRYVKSLFTNIQKQYNMVKINLQEIYKLHEQINWEFLGLRMRNFQSFIFIWIQTYSEVFESALVYLEKHQWKACFAFFNQGLAFWIVSFPLGNCLLCSKYVVVYRSTMSGYFIIW